MFYDRRRWGVETRRGGLAAGNGPW